MISAATYAFVVVPLIVCGFAALAVAWALGSTARVDRDTASDTDLETDAQTALPTIVGKATTPHYGVLKHG